MTFGELAEIVLNNIERTASDSAVDESNVKRWINEAIRFYFCTKHNWDAMERTHTVNTVADQELYGFPSENTKDIQSVALRLDSGSPYCMLGEESGDQLDYNSPVTSLGGVPDRWARAGDAFRLRPVPDVSTYGLRVRSYEYPALLVSDSDTNYWTVSHWDLVIQIATGLAWFWTGQSDRYQSMWQVAMPELEHRIIDDMRRLRPKRTVITPSSAAGRPASNASRQGTLGIYRQYP